MAPAHFPCAALGDSQKMQWKGRLWFSLRKLVCPDWKKRKEKHSDSSQVFNTTSAVFLFMRCTNVDPPAAGEKRHFLWTCIYVSAKLSSKQEVFAFWSWIAFVLIYMYIYTYVLNCASRFPHWSLPFFCSLSLITPGGETLEVELLREQRQTQTTPRFLD